MLFVSLRGQVISGGGTEPSTPVDWKVNQSPDFIGHSAKMVGEIHALSVSAGSGDQIGMRVFLHPNPSLLSERPCLFSM